jgi:nucleotide-binding universal stress UspA family protein
MEKQILFPTDFSPCAERAFSHAAHLAACHNAQLHILSVIDVDHDDVSPMAYLPLGQDELAAELGIRDAGELRSEAGTYPGSNTINVTLRAPSPWRAILDYAEKNEIDLIVMGTHGRHGVDRILMGSVAEQVVRRAKCPVLTVAATESRQRKDGPIVVPVDFSNFTEAAITEATELARAYNSELYLVHVVEPITLPTVYGVDPMPSLVPDMESRAAEALVELASSRIPDDISWSTRVLVGHATHEIVTWAEEVGARMIIIATHGLTGLKRLLMGSVTERIVREAPCPVFTVRSFGKRLSNPTDASAEVNNTVNV